MEEPKLVKIFITTSSKKCDAVMIAKVLEEVLQLPKDFCKNAAKQILSTSVNSKAYWFSKCATEQQLLKLLQRLSFLDCNVTWSYTAYPNANVTKNDVTDIKAAVKCIVDFTEQIAMLKIENEKLKKQIKKLKTILDE